MRWGVIVVAVCVLGACSGGGSRRPDAKRVLGQITPFVAPATSPTTKPPATTTSTTVKPTDALAIAKALGCDKPEALDSSGLLFPGLPNPVQEAECTISGVDLDVSVFKDHADLAKLQTFGGKLVLCAFIRAFDVKGPQYLVEGDNFDVTASTSTSGDSQGSFGTLAQARALSRALDLPIVKFDC